MLKQILIFLITGSENRDLIYPHMLSYTASCFIAYYT